VASVRKIKWDSFQPNFFIVFPPGLLDEMAGTWMTSAYFGKGDGRVIADLVRRFPSVSVFDLDDLLTQVRSVIDKPRPAPVSITVAPSAIASFATPKASDESVSTPVMTRRLPARIATWLR